MKMTVRGFIVDAFMFKTKPLKLVVKPSVGDKIIVNIDEFYPFFYVQKTPYNILILLEANYSTKYIHKISEETKYINSYDQIQFIKLIFENKLNMASMKSRFVENHITIYNYEDNLEYHFFNHYNIDPSCCIEFSEYRISQKEYHVKASDIRNYQDNSIISKLSCIGFDIEVETKGKFPVAKNIDDKVIAISFCTFTWGGKCKYSIIYLSKHEIEIDRDKYDISFQKAFANEYEMLRYFIILINKYDIIFDFNGTLFDIPYIITRLESIYHHSMINYFPCFISVFHGKVRTYGLVHLDLYSTFTNRDADKNKENSLNFLSKKYLRSEIMSLDGCVITCKPIDIVVKMEFDIVYDFLEEIISPYSGLVVEEVQQYEDRTVITTNKCVKPIDDMVFGKKPKLYLALTKNQMDVTQMSTDQASDDEIRKILIYCVNDTRLTKYLLDKQHFLTTYIQKSNIRKIILRDSVIKGNSFLNQAMITRQLVNNNHVIPYKISSKNSIHDGYEGATVINPIPGVYTGVFVLDFNSLYPTIIIAYNICITTLVTKYIKNKYNVPDEYLHEIQVEGETIYFLKKEIKEGIIPSFCSSFISSRAEVQKQMKNSTEQVFLNIKQLNLKVSNNSIYGTLGDANSIHFNKYIAAAITSLGRRHLAQMKDFFSAQNYKIIGGDTDSIFVDIGLSNQFDSLIAQFNTQLPSPMKIEKEKQYKKLFISSKKKRRFGVICGSDKIETKGILSIKRDTTLIVKKIEIKIIEILLINNEPLEESISKIKLYIKEVIMSLRSFSCDHFTITKTLRSEYKTDSVCHLTLVKRLISLKLLDENAIGNKVTYVFVKEYSHKRKNGDKIMMPKFLDHFNLNIDYNKYKDDIFSMINQTLDNIVDNSILYDINRIIYF